MNDMTLSKLTVNQLVMLYIETAFPEFASCSCDVNNVCALYYEMMTTVPAVNVKLMGVIVASWRAEFHLKNTYYFALTMIDLFS